MKLKLSILVTLFLAACQTGPTDYGTYPVNYESIIKEYLHQTLNDPYSVQDLYIPKPYKFGNIYHAGYKSCISLNAKNRFGAYTGINEFQVIIRNGEVISYRRGCGVGVL